MWCSGIAFNTQSLKIFSEHTALNLLVVIDQKHRIIDINGLGCHSFGMSNDALIIR